MSPDPFRRLRIALSLWYAGVFTVILLVLGAATYTYLAVALMRNVDRFNQLALLDVRESLSTVHGRLTVEPAAFREEFAEAQTVYRIRWVRVLGPDGRVLAEAGRPLTAVATAGPATETRRVGDENWRLLREPIATDGRAIGTIEVARAQAERDGPLASLAHALMVAIPGAVGVTLLAGALLAGLALRPAREAFERQRRFIADASHELRTPISVVLAQSQVGQEGSPEDARRALETIERTARRMGALAADLLFLSRADASALSLERRRFYLDELAEQAVADLAPLARERGVRLHAELVDADLAVVADPERLQQLLTILIDNALAFTPSPGAVMVRVRRLGEREAELAVVDTGIGIAPEALPRVFDRFYMADPARSGARGGSGLGLAIAQAIVRAHGGDIAVESQPGQGAAFRCRLPLGGPS